MTQFNWSVDYLKKYSSVDEYSDIVYAVGYNCTGINTSGILTTTYNKIKIVGFSTGGLIEPTPYESLTEDIVIGWLSDEIKVAVEINVEGNINGNDETLIKNFPWS